MAEAGSGAAAPAAAGQSGREHRHGPARAAQSLPAQGLSVQSPPVQSPPVQSEDSLNLVSLVGPAILKRVVPVLLAVAVITLLGRRFLRRGDRGQKG